MFEECERFHGNKKKICRGEKDLPLWKINTYRTRWGLEPLSDDVKPKNSDIVKPIKVNANIVKYGPGTELIKIYDRLGIPSCSQCHALADKMNDWGVQGCIDRVDYIVEDILPRAKSWIANEKPWINKMIPNRLTEMAVKSKIRQDVITAIERAKKEKAPAKPTPVRKIRKARASKGGCGCGRK